MSPSRFVATLVARWRRRRVMRAGAAGLVARSLRRLPGPRLELRLHLDVRTAGGRVDMAPLAQRLAGAALQRPAVGISSRPALQLVPLMPSPRPRTLQPSPRRRPGIVVDRGSTWPRVLPPSIAAVVAATKPTPRQHTGAAPAIVSRSLRAVAPKGVPAAGRVQPRAAAVLLTASLPQTAAARTIAWPGGPAPTVRPAAAATAIVAMVQVRRPSILRGSGADVVRPLERIVAPNGPAPRTNPRAGAICPMLPKRGRGARVERRPEALPAPRRVVQATPPPSQGGIAQAASGPPQLRAADAFDAAAFEKQLVARVERQIDQRVSAGIEASLQGASGLSRRLAERVDETLYDRMVLERERRG